MPSQKSYEVNSAPNSQTRRDDQSYRSCLLALIIFFFLCIILILASLPWKNRDPGYEEEQSATSQSHRVYHPEETTATTKFTEYSNTKSTFTRSEETRTTTEAGGTTMDEKLITTEIDDELTTQESVVDSTNGSNKSTNFGKSGTETTTEEVLTTTVTDDELTTQEYIIDSTNGGNKSAKFLGTESTTEEATTIDNELTTIHEVYDSGSTTDINATTVTLITRGKEEINTESSTNSIDLELIDEANSTTSEMYKTTTEIIKGTTSNEDLIESTIDSNQNTSTDSITLDAEESITQRMSVVKNAFNSSNERVCKTGECKNMASKMLFSMNHTIDPCEDFYEYACGGFETSSLTVEQKLEDMAYQRILQQMEKEKRRGVSSPFIKYYNSCLHYENVDLEEKKKLARQMLNKVGTFYTNEEAWRESGTNFTEIFANLLLQNSALLFDVSPDLDEYHPKQFTLKIGPTTYKNPFETEDTDDPCFASQLERERDTVNLEELYKEYKNCKMKNNYQATKFGKSIKVALSELGVFNKTNATAEEQNIHKTIFYIDMKIMKEFLANYPSKGKIREAYLTKNYTRITIKELDTQFKIVNWTQLTYLLTKEMIKPQAQVQVYFYDVLVQGLRSLEKFRNQNPIHLNNALLGLYARDIYHELVVPKYHNIKEHCLRVATNILIPEASNLYISSFSNDQLEYMNKTIRSLFEELKKTLKLKVMEVEVAEPEERDMLIAKIDDLRVAVPDMSYLTDKSSTYSVYGALQIELSDNYFKNSIKLMERYRKLIYQEFFTNPGDPEQIWTHYATPFQSKGLAIYGLNLVVIPFGVIDWSMKYDERSFDYIILATLGNVIAHQIAHHFDANGINYWNGTRDTDSALLSNYQDYIKNQEEIIYGKRTITIPSTGQTLLYEILQISLNERLSESIGLRLAYDTLGRLRSPEEVHLPWLKLNTDQLFYLSYAQMHCTKLPLTSSYVSLYENEQLPSRLRIFVSASNDRLLGKAWECPRGSGMMPSLACSPFPYLECS